MTELAVVLISRNQGWNIARLVESVLQQTACVQSAQIILVDSASTDDTIDVASRYPIGIIQLRPDQILTPSAGRYIGYWNTVGALILFLDGDMELYPGWLEKALRLIESRPDVAALTGQLVDLPKTAAPNDRLPTTMADTESATLVPFAGGAAMYRRSVLDRVGTFNPYLHSDEEPELCIRIRHAGYSVIQLEHPIAYHYSDPSQALSTLIARWKRKLYLGYGQIIRYHLGNVLIWSYLRQRGYALHPALGLLLGITTFSFSLLSNNWVWFGSWTALLVLVLAGDTWRKRSFYRVIFSLVTRLMILDGTLRGLLLKPLNPDTYPGRMDLIKKPGIIEQPTSLWL